MSETIEKKFKVTAPARLLVNNIRGSVEIARGDEDVIQISAIKHSHSGDEKRTQIEITQEADGTVKAATHYPDGGWTWMFGSQPCEVDYVIKAPRQCSLKINGVSNSVLAEGFEGEVSINSVSGEITIHDLKGSVRIHSVSGDTDGDRLNGSLVVDSVSGDVTLKECNLPSIQGKTVSGDIRIATPLSAGPYGFKSVSGDVRLTLPPNTHCSGELHTISGDLVSAFPITGSSSHHGSQSINVQGGGVRIALNSISGDLSLDSDEEIPAYSEPSRPITSEERRSLLESVERGELTVEQALGKLHP